MPVVTRANARKNARNGTGGVSSPLRQQSTIKQLPLAPHESFKVVPANKTPAHPKNLRFETPAPSEPYYSSTVLRAPKKDLAKEYHPRRLVHTGTLSYMPENAEGDRDAERTARRPRRDSTLGPLNFHLYRQDSQDDRSLQRVDTEIIEEVPFMLASPWSSPPSPVRGPQPRALGPEGTVLIDHATGREKLAVEGRPHTYTERPVCTERPKIRILDHETGEWLRDSKGRFIFQDL